MSALRFDGPVSSWEEPAESTFDPEGAHRDGAAPDDSGEVFDQLGRGAGGVVLSGRDRHLPRTVAWKVARGAKAKARLAHEARVLAALEHPAIVAIHDLVEGDDDSLRIALRMVRGQTLHTLVRKAMGSPSGSLPKAASLAERLRLVRPFLQAVEAVAWAHRLGWVHRDLKPANIMIGEFGETQVIDWGLAENLDDPSEAPGALVGTLGMMSPEQARGEAVATGFDVWGLGATLFEILAGRSLHPSSEDLPGGPEALLDRVRRGERPSVAAACPGAPAELIAIVERCLAPEPEARYPDARALAIDLAAFLDGRQVAAHDYSALELLVRFVRAWRLPLGIALAALVTGAIAAGVAFDHIGDERDRAVRANEAAKVALAERDEQIASGGVIEARRALADEQRPEAELAAARTLEVRESPEARGVVAAFERTSRFARTFTRALPFPCIDVAVAPGGRHTLCGSRDALVVLAGDTPIWSWNHAYRGAVFIAGGALVLVAPVGGDPVAFDVADGSVVRTYSSSACPGALTSDRTQTFALSLDYSCAETYSAEGMIAEDPCDRRHIQVAAVDATPAGMRLAGLCMGGDLVVHEPDGARRRLPTPLGDTADTLLTGSFFGSDALIAGSSRGELVVLDLGDGHVRARRRLPLAEAIRGFAVAPEVDRLIVASEGQGLLVASFSTLAPIARLPRGEAQLVTLDGRTPGGTLLTYGGGLSGWSLTPGPPARFDALGGVTSAVHDGRRLVVTHDTVAVVMDPADGRVEAEASWDRVIAKQAVVEDRTLRVAIAGRVGGEPLVSAGSTSVPAIDTQELAAMRRVAILSGGRKVGSRTGLGLVYWPTATGEWEEVAHALVTELAVRDDVAVALFQEPREAVVYDLHSAPLELGRCPMPSASAVAHAVGPGDSEIVVLAATPSAIIAYRLGPPDVESAIECPIVGVYSAPGGELTRVTATGDGRYVGGGTRDGTVHVWQADGTLVASVPSHESSVTTLTVDPDDRWFISGAWDGRVSFLALDLLATPRAELVDQIRRGWLGPTAP